MTRNNKIREIFHQIIIDQKIIFIILATLLITMSSILTNVVSFNMESNIRSVLIGLTYAFAWVTLAWLITDKSIVRKPWPYLGIFIPLFFVKIYWNLFMYLFPPTYEKGTVLSDALALGMGSYRISPDWYNLRENAYILFIILEFIIIIIVLIILWYLSRPKDIAQKGFLKSKRTILVILGAFFLSMPYWIFRVIVHFYGYSWIRNYLCTYWYEFILYQLPIIIAMVILAVIITNIKSRLKYGLYGLIFLFLFIPQMPISNFKYWPVYSDPLNVISYYVVFGVCYFIIFLCLLVLSKTKYLE